jgi:hypothetical protein
VFGPAVVVDSPVAALLAAGSALALGSLAITVLVMAQNRAPALVRAWLAGAGAALVVLLSGSGSATLNTSWAFVAAETTAFLFLVVEQVRGTVPVTVREP